MSETEQRQKPVCRTCGSEDIQADAFAVWDVENQRWDVADVFDKGSVCNECDGECRIEWVPA